MCWFVLSQGRRRPGGDAMTSWETLYPDGTWVTGDDSDDARAPEASCPAERGRGLKAKIYLKAPELRFLRLHHTNLIYLLHTRHYYYCGAGAALTLISKETISSDKVRMLCLESSCSSKISLLNKRLKRSRDHQREISCDYSARINQCGRYRDTFRVTFWHPNMFHHDQAAPFMRNDLKLYKYCRQQ